MGFQQALSGLNASSQQLSAIGNNVANASTVGFKGSQIQFGDAYASSMQGGGSSAIGIGTQVTKVAQSFTQGNLTTSSNPLDMAINGGGMFRMNSGGNVTYSRNGQFLLDKSGFIVNSQGAQLTGYAADPTTFAIVPGYIVPLQINNSAIAPLPTSLSQVQVNLDSRAVPPVSMLSGNSTGSAPPINYSVVPLAVPNNDFKVAVDGFAAVTVTVPPGLYASANLLASAIQTAANTALAATSATVKVSLDIGSNLVVTSSSVGSNGVQGQGSSVVLSAGGGTGFADMYGAAPTATAGTDNFKVTDTNSYTASTAQTVFDTLGNPHTLSLYYCKTSTPGRWQFYSALDGALSALPKLPLVVAPAVQPMYSDPTNLTFGTSGILATPAPGALLDQQFTVTTGALPTMDFKIDLSGTSQYGINFGTNQLIQDGYTSGKLSGMSVSNDGTVQGRFSNGKSRNMGQIVLANFNNPNGLSSLGNNQWAESSDSGSPIPGSPGSGNLGLIQSGSVEDSNVDMTAELVNMITAQRSYQANAQTIKTMDQIMQTLVNLR